MDRKRNTLVSPALFGGCLVAALGLVLGLETGAATAQAKKQSAAGVAPTTIVVTAGKPSESSLTLSKSAAIPAGKIVFEVTNKGRADHGFEICTSPVTTAKAGSCVGKATKSLTPGQSAALTVTLAKAGKYEYLSKLPGQAAAGTKGLINVAAKAAASGGLTPTTTAPGKVITTPALPTTTTTTSAPATCANPQSTTVQVAEFEYAFTLSRLSVPCGTVTFAMTNTGQIQHNFDVLGLKNDAGDGAFLDPGGRTSMTVTLTPGQYPYQCDEAGHAGMGMAGTLTVTG